MDLAYLLSIFAEWTISYLSFTSLTTRPMSLLARSGAVLTVTSLKGPRGRCSDMFADERKEGKRKGGKRLKFRK